MLEIWDQLPSFQGTTFYPIVFTCHPDCNIIPQKAMTPDKDAHDILHSERLVILPPVKHTAYSALWLNHPLLQGLIEGPE